MKHKISIITFVFCVPAGIFFLVKYLNVKAPVSGIVWQTNRGDLDHCRDIAATVGAAVVWLDCTRDDERAMYQNSSKTWQIIANSVTFNANPATVPSKYLPYPPKMTWKSYF